MKPRTIALLAAFGLAAWLWGTAPVGAQPIACGGNQHTLTAPIECANTHTIDGTTFTADVQITVDGHVTVTYTLAAPRAADTPIRVRWHRGISSTPVDAEVSGTIPAGATSAVLTLNGSQCDGQLDVKAVYTANGDSHGRLTAPAVFAPNCRTVTTTTTVPSSSSTSVPSTTRPTGSTSSVPTTTPGTAPPSVPGTIPRTGSDDREPVLVACLALVAGLGLVVLARRRRAT